MSLGKSVSTAVDEQGLAWSWGSNKFGEIGVGDNEPRVHPFPLLNLKGKTVTKVCCGDQFTICLGRQVRKEIPSRATMIKEKNTAREVVLTKIDQWFHNDASTYDEIAHTFL